MPNDCVNRVTIYADEATTAKLSDLGFRFPDLVPEPAEPIHETWGSDRFYDYILHEAGQGAIAFTFTSAWAPPNKLFDLLLRAEPGITFIKNDWSVEDGIAGIWIGSRFAGEQGCSTESMQWDEGCIEERAHRFRKATSVPSQPLAD